MRLPLAPLPMYAGLVGLMLGAPKAYFEITRAVWGQGVGVPWRAFTEFFNGPIDFFGWDRSWVDLLFLLVFVLLANFFTLRLRRLPIGRAWEALREDEIACRSLGIDTVVTKLSAFAIGAMIAGFAGVLFAARQGGVAPESFTFLESAMVLAIVVLGGLGSQLGVAIAAIVLAGGAERLRDLQEYRMLIFGLTMVLVMLLRPRGLMSGRTPSASIGEARSISASFVKEGHG